MRQRSRAKATTFDLKRKEEERRDLRLALLLSAGSMGAPILWQKWEPVMAFISEKTELVLSVMGAFFG